MESQGVKKISRLRTAIPQILAVSAKNLILFDVGLGISFPTIVIPSVQNSPGEPSLDDEQTSWFSSISMICSPLGGVLSGILLERLGGRKISLMVVNIPFLLSWGLFYFVNNSSGLLVAAAMLGFGMGFVKAPILTYVAEVSQPQLRGMLAAYSEMCMYIGAFYMNLVGTVTDWRTTAAMNAAVPIISVVVLTQVPESPAWLMSRDRAKEAERSLCWLRGWVEPAAVQEELSELRSYCQKTEDARARGFENEGFVRSPGSEADVRYYPEQGSSTQKVAVSENSRSNANLVLTMKAMLKPETLRPFVMVTVMSFLNHWSGITSTRPYFVQLFDEFGTPIDAHWATVVTSLLAISGALACLVAVPWCGKRPLVFVSTVGSIVGCALLGTYAYLTPTGGNLRTNWMPLVLFIFLAFLHSLALSPVPWILLSEIFPFRTRSLAAGTAAALNLTLAFFATKTFLELKAGLGLHGVFWLYAALTALGSVYLMFELKETEGKSLQDIENHYKTTPMWFGKSRRAVFSAEVVQGRNVEDCEIQEDKPTTSSDDEVSSVHTFHLSIEDGESHKGSISQYSEENTEARSSIVETKSADGNCGDKSANADIPSQQSVTFFREDRQKEMRERPGNSELLHDRQSEGQSSLVGRGGEGKAYTVGIAGRQTYLPEAAQLKKCGENSPDGSCRL